ncbi:MAG TPA: 2Fe-2S iron-sulfur cluster-binding protein [Bellilinea sp.]|nr:2Fe-2S iron-sulfur cluster-binding protein [Bellilinea sp.]
MISLTINDKKVEVAEGTTVLQASRQAGIDIPTLCDHPHLTPFGGCRLCMVEIEGFRTLQSACTIPAANNMVVKTGTEKVNSARKFVLSLIFSERNHFCPYCQVSGSDCELQNAAYDQGMTHWPIMPTWQNFPVDASHPYFILEHNRCILCRRCIRACNELVGVNTLGVEERGAKTIVIADLNVPLGESTCVSCGSCVQVCPTGALIDRQSAYLGPNKKLDHTRSICLGCSIGCGIDIDTRDSQLIRVDGDWDAPLNEGVLCKVGRYYPVTDDRIRLTKPMLRKDGRLQPVSWDEALASLKDKLSGSSKIRALVSENLSCETLHAAKQLFQSATKNIKLNLVSETSVPDSLYDTAKQSGPFETTLDALKTADGFVVIGSDLMKVDEVAGFFVRRTIQNGAPLIIIDDEATGLDEFANCLLQVKPDQVQNVLDAISAATRRIGESKANVPGDSVEAFKDAADKSGISTDLLLEAAYKLSNCANPAVFYNSIKAGDAGILASVIQLARVTGAGVVSTKGGANGLAAAQYEITSTIDDSSADVVFVALGDDVPSEKLVRSLEKETNLVVQASYESKLSAAAWLVLPVNNWVEQGGHYLNSSGKLQEARKALEPLILDLHTNEEVIKLVAEKLGEPINDNWKEDLFKRPSPVAISE